MVQDMGWLALSTTVLCTIAAVGAGMACGAEDLHVDVDWEQFLARSDPSWEIMPSSWADAPFIGNGWMGSYCYEGESVEGPALNFVISRTDVYDHRKSTAFPFSIARARLPNGRFKLRYAGAEPEGTMRLDLWDAEVEGTVETSVGKLSLRAFAHATRNVIVIETEASGGERNYGWHWYPDTVVSPRLLSGRARRHIEPFVENPHLLRPYPPQRQFAVEGVRVSVQEMPEDEVYDTDGQGAGQFATAWKVVEAGQGQRVIYISENFSYPGRTALQEAVETVKRAAADGVASLRATHRRWWHEFYPRSFYSLPTAKLEGFYWIQMYKMGSASRERGPVVDLNGPWFPWNLDNKTGCVWPGIWFNLNTQNMYAPWHMSNHVREGLSLVNHLWKYRENLAKNAGEYSGDSLVVPDRCGITLRAASRGSIRNRVNLAWALFDVWEQYRATMDMQLLREKLYPLMVGAFRYIDHHIREGEDGMLHMPKARNPEYRGGVDTSYELSLTRWICRAIIRANEDLGRDDPITDRCREVLANILPYHTHPEEGFLIADDTRLERGHRHWSHLLMIYPLFEYNADSPPQERALAKRSADHWTRLTVKPDLSGARNAWPKFAAAGLKASLGAGDKAVRLLESGVDDIHRMTRNTFAREGGPIGEVPLLGARVMQDLVLQDHDGIMRVFPTVGDAWQHVVIHKFRADGGFLVSARREDGETQFVRIQSTAGEPCRIRTSLPGAVRAYGPRDYELREKGDVVEVDLRKGEWVILYSGEDLPDLTISPVDLPDDPNYWGAKR